MCDVNEEIVRHRTVDEQATELFDILYSLFNVVNETHITRTSWQRRRQLTD